MFWKVMQAKLMHELYSLLMHTPTCLDVVGCYNHIWYGFMGIFHFGYNYAEQETPILCILTFQGLLELKLIEIFFGMNIFT
jgi:hypothetical protein